MGHRILVDCCLTGGLVLCRLPPPVPHRDLRRQVENGSLEEVERNGTAGTYRVVSLTGLEHCREVQRASSPLQCGLRLPGCCLGHFHRCRRCPVLRDLRERCPCRHSGHVDCGFSKGWPGPLIGLFHFLRSRTASSVEHTTRLLGSVSGEVGHFSPFCLMKQICRPKCRSRRSRLVSGRGARSPAP